MKVFELGVVEIVNETVVYNYYLYKELKSQNLLERIKKFFEKYNLNYKILNIEDLWNKKDKSQEYILLYDSADCSLILREKLIEN